MTALIATGPPPRHRFLLLGVVVLLLVPVVYGGSAILGNSGNIASGPPVTRLAVTMFSTYALCNLLSFPVASLSKCPTGGAGPGNDFELSTAPYFDAVSGNTVVVTAPAWISIRNGVQGPDVVPTFSPTCAPEAIFPGGGNEVTISCATTSSAGNATLLFVNTLTGQVAASLALPPNEQVPVAGYAWIPGEDRLYLESGFLSTGTAAHLWVGTVLTIDTSTHLLVGTSVLSYGSGPGPIAWDPVHRALLYYNETSGGLQEMIPGSGAVSFVGMVPAQPTSLTVVANGQQLLVGLPAGADATRMLNLTTFGLEAMLPVGSRCGAIMDPVDELVFVSDCQTISEIDPVGDMVIGSLDEGGPAWAGGWTLDPSTGQFLIGQPILGGNPSVGVTTVAPIATPGAGYGAVPFVGASFPTAAGISCGLLGAVLIAVPGVREVRASIRYDDAIEEERWAKRWKREEERRLAREVRAGPKRPDPPT